MSASFRGAISPNSWEIMGYSPATKVIYLGYTVMGMFVVLALLGGDHPHHLVDSFFGQVPSNSW